MDVTSTNSVTKTSTSSFAYNPKSELTGDDFMKLFLTELQYQDPTAPMENKDMLQQTSMLTQLQSNQDLSKTLQQLTTQMGSSTQFSAVSMIGKMADTGANGFAVSNAANLTEDIPFDLYFKDDYVSGVVEIKDKNGDVIRTFNLEADTAGMKNFRWDGKDDNGNPVSDGEYYVSADYKDNNYQNKTTLLGVYPINSVRFENGEALLNIDNKYIPLSSIKEVLEG